MKVKVVGRADVCGGGSVVPTFGNGDTRGAVGVGWMHTSLIPVEESLKGSLRSSWTAPAFGLY